MRNLTLLLWGLALFISLSANAQSITVTGKVKDDKGQPLASASIQEKGTKNGAVSSSDGSFSLKVSSTKSVLIISSLGYETVEISASSSNILVTLKPDVKTLSEVVVTGVGVATSKKKVPFAVESITSDKLPAAPTASIDQALVGKVAGAQISSVSGVPGASVNILLRGINTLQGGTFPMILLDGVQVSATNLNSLDLSTIERVEIIQGAAAATIYGAQGANGVIQLFSKKGSKDGKVNVDISSSAATNTYLNIGGLRKARVHGFETDDQNNVVDGDGNPLEFDPYYGYVNNLIWNSTDPATITNKPYNQNLKYYDHFKEFFVTAPTFNNAISISGGRDKMDFSLSLSNSYQKSTFKDNGYLNRTNLTSNIGFEVLKNLKFRSITELIYTRNTINGDQGLIYPVFNSRPFVDYNYKDPDGNYLIYYGDAPGVNGANPNYIQQYTHTKDNKADIVQNFSLNYKPIKYLELDAKYGFNYQKQDINYLWDNQTQNVNSDYWAYWYNSKNSSDASGEFYNYNYTTTFQNFIGTATIRTDFDKDFHLNVPVTTSTQLTYDVRKNIFNDYETSGIGLPLYAPYNQSTANDYKVYTDYTEKFITYGYLLNQIVDFGNWGGVSGGFRSDYSSAFGAGSKPFTFPHGAAYIVPSAFDFWSNSNFAKTFSFFKLRAAYGEAGIQPGAYQRYITLNTPPLGNGVVFTTPTQSSNPDLGVEVSKELEIGTDMTFTNAHGGDWFKTANVSVTYWKRKTENAIWPLDVASSSGVGSITDNSFGLKSDGWQGSVNLNVITTRDFTWNFTTLISNESSEITSIKNGIPIPVSSAAGSSSYVLDAGYKVGQLFGYVGLHSVDEINPATGESYIPKEEQSSYTVASNGWVVNKDTKQPYFTPDAYSFGDPNPDFNASLINDISYKSFLSFSMQWDWVQGSHLYNQTKEWMYRDGIHSDYEIPITIDGETAAYSAFYRGVYAQVERNGTKNYFYEDASFMRLRNISLAIDFARLFPQTGFRKLQLVLTGRNLVTLTNYTGMDPEISSGSSNSAFDRGVDHNTMPNLRTYQVGVNIGF